MLQSIIDRPVISDSCIDRKRNDSFKCWQIRVCLCIGLWPSLPLGCTNHICPFLYASFINHRTQSFEYLLPLFADHHPLDCSAFRQIFSSAIIPCCCSCSSSLSSIPQLAMFLRMLIADFFVVNNKHRSNEYLMFCCTLFCYLSNKQ